jgi:hypothetical protein
VALSIPDSNVADSRLTGAIKWPRPRCGGPFREGTAIANACDWPMLVRSESMRLRLFLLIAIAGCGGGATGTGTGGHGGVAATAGTGGGGGATGTGGDGGGAATGTGGVGGTTGTGGTGVVGAGSAGTIGAGGGGSGGTTGTAGTGGAASACAGGPTHCGGINATTPCAIAAPAVPTSPPAEVTECNLMAAGLDACGCDGKTCAAGQTCTHALMGGSGGPDFYVNRCSSPCVASTDCGSNNACLPDIAAVFECRPAQCRSDADCTRDGCGHCAPALRSTHIIGATPVPDVHVCQYEGLCTESSCAGCANSANTYVNPALPGYHVCLGN